jgi:aspartyl-tRNA(Asn)/glutamyl-tRNA(Gln) amidotransferase subunit C
MISGEEIKKLADLARIEIKEEEIESLRGEMDAILDYVGQVKSVVGGDVEGLVPSLNDKRGLGGDINVMREDESASWRTTESGTYNKELIAEFPKSENNYLKVKKIL